MYIQAIWLQTQHSYLLHCSASLCTITTCPKLYQTDTKKVCGNNKVKSNGYPCFMATVTAGDRPGSPEEVPVPSLLYPAP